MTHTIKMLQTHWHHEQEISCVTMGYNKLTKHIHATKICKDPAGPSADCISCGPSQEPITNPPSWAKAVDASSGTTLISKTNKRWRSVSLWLLTGLKTTANTAQDAIIIIETCGTSTMMS